MMLFRPAELHLVSAQGTMKFWKLNLGLAHTKHVPICCSIFWFISLVLPPGVLFHNVTGIKLVDGMVGLVL